MSSDRPARTAEPLVAVLLIAVRYAAGLAVHYRWYEGMAKPWLSFHDRVTAHEVEHRRLVSVPLTVDQPLLTLSLST
jgi:hypothetical protein